MIGVWVTHGEYQIGHPEKELFPSLLRSLEIQHIAVISLATLGDHFWAVRPPELAAANSDAVIDYYGFHFAWIYAGLQHCRPAPPQPRPYRLGLERGGKAGGWG